jgi:ABC-2 type transport system permease protein
MHAIGNFAAGAVSFGIGWSLLSPPGYTLALVPLWVLSGTVVYTSVLVLVGSLAFRLVTPSVPYLFTVHQMLGTSRYPITIYPRWLHLVLLYVLPFGTAIFIPANFLRGEGPLWQALVLPPLGAFGIALVAKRAWTSALNGYQSSGS